ncbi:hypothetical protein [Streptomyces sp. NPDC014006]|uniref:hypothetical protein n=1 Tax=Streptomyces sp. NPDC014006 TaxID=3364870 RepID=UPI003701E439
MLTCKVVRLEYSTKDFLDLPSFNVLNRQFTVPHYTTSEQDGWLPLRTDDLVLRYRIGSGPFTAENTRVTLLRRPADGNTEITPGCPGECTLGRGRGGRVRPA